MLDIILLYFLARHIGKLALKKGLPPMPWKLRLIGLWLGFELLGLFLGVAFFGTGNMPALISLGFVSAFGGYLLTKYMLDNKPDQKQFDDIDNIGNNH